MPVHEIGSRMHRRGHVHVNDYEIIVARDSTRIFPSREFTRLGQNTFDSSNVL